METQTAGAAQRVDDLFSNLWVVVRGGGDLASGAIQRLRWAGFPVVVTELPQPLVVRRLVSFSNAVFEQDFAIEKTPTKLVNSASEAQAYIQNNPEGVPVIVDPEGKILDDINPAILIDGRMAKTPLDTHIDQAPMVIAIGPGLEAGVHADAVIETKGGSQCGRVFFTGGPIPDDGTPCNSSGFRHERVIRAPASGVFEGQKNIEDMVEAGEVVGHIQTSEGKVPVKTEISGVLRGLLYSGIKIPEGMKLGDIDHRGESSDCCRVSEKADSIAAGVLEAIMKLGIQKGMFSR